MGQMVPLMTPPSRGLARGGNVRAVGDSGPISKSVSSLEPKVSPNSDCIVFDSWLKLSRTMRLSSATVLPSQVTEPLPPGIMPTVPTPPLPPLPAEGTPPPPPPGVVELLGLPSTLPHAGRTKLARTIDPRAARLLTRYFIEGSS